MVTVAATGMVETTVTAAMATVETKGMEVATDMAATRVTAATRATVAATEATRAMVATKGMTRTRATAVTKATEEIKAMANSLMAAIKDMASSLMAATKDTEGNRAVTTPRATAAGEAREGTQRTSTAGKPPDTLHDSSKNWLV